MISKMLIYISSIGIIGVLVLISPITCWNPEKGEFSGRKISYYEVLANNPDQIIKFLLLWAFVVVLAGLICFIKGRNK